MRALIGAQGTGKTTLLKALNKKHPEITVSDGSSRPMKAIAKRLGLSHQEYQIANNIFSEHRYRDFVDQPNYFTTRTLLDNYIYTKLAGDLEEAERILKVFLDSDFSKIEYFYLPIEFELEEDGVRSGDREFQKQVDREIIDILAKYQIRYKLLFGSVDNRIEQIENYL